MSQSEEAAAKVVAVHADRPAEHLFFAQYRHWMAGYATGDIFPWDCAWDALLKYVSFDAAEALYAEFHLFIRSLNNAAGRNCGWRPDVCRCLCRDEYLALMLVGASQRADAEEEMRAMTALVGGDHRAVVQASRRLAATLKRCELMLAPIRGQQTAAPRRMMPDRHTVH
ncbi:MAG: hypothetical protein ACLP8A_14595 [Methylovirgula sp.]